MITISAYSVEKVKDPFGILAGERFEFMLDIEVPDDDELFSEQGIYVRAIFKLEAERSGLAKYELIERSSDKYIDIELEDEELAAVEQFCRDHWQEAEA